MGSKGERMLQSESGSAGSSTKALREQFIGTWKLVSIESEESRLFGDRPVGLLIYDAEGHVAVQIMRNPRPRNDDIFSKALMAWISSACAIFTSAAKFCGAAVPLNSS